MRLYTADAPSTRRPAAERLTGRAAHRRFQNEARVAGKWLPVIGYGIASAGRVVVLGPRDILFGPRNITVPLAIRLETVGSVSHECEVDRLGDNPMILGRFHASGRNRVLPILDCFHRSIGEQLAIGRLASLVGVKTVHVHARGRGTNHLAVAPDFNRYVNLSTDPHAHGSNRIRRQLVMGRNKSRTSGRADLIGDPLPLSKAAEIGA